MTRYLGKKPGSVGSNTPWPSKTVIKNTFRKTTRRSIREMGRAIRDSWWLLIRPGLSKEKRDKFLLALEAKMWPPKRKKQRRYKSKGRGKKRR